VTTQGKKGGEAAEEGNRLSPFRERRSHLGGAWVWVCNVPGKETTGGGMSEQAFRGKKKKTTKAFQKGGGGDPKVPTPCLGGTVWCERMASKVIGKENFIISLKRGGGALGS